MRSSEIIFPAHSPIDQGTSRGVDAFRDQVTVQYDTRIGQMEHYCLLSVKSHLQDG